MQAIHGVAVSEGFVREPAALFDRLLSTTQWDETMAARKTASFGVPYNYSQISYPETPFPSLLESMRRDLQGELGPVFNNCLINLYLDGSSSMGFHSDDTSSLQHGSGVAIVSLGFERSITFRSKADKSIEISVALPSGSLLYMDGTVQDQWLHGIGPVDEAEPRMSLTWRAFT